MWGRAMRNVTKMGAVASQVEIRPGHWILVVVDGDRAFAVEAHEADGDQLTTTSAPIDINAAVAEAQAVLCGVTRPGPVNAQFRTLAAGLMAMAGLAKSCAGQG
jgi:hypothetical protein